MRRAQGETAPSCKLQIRQRKCHYVHERRHQEIQGIILYMYVAAPNPTDPNGLENVE